MNFPRHRLAARLFALDPAGLGGIWLRGDGPARDAALEELRAALGPRLRRMPASIDDERLLGGLDLGASLAAGRAVVRAGLLAEADGGALMLTMAERTAEATAGRILGALDQGRVRVEREGASIDTATRFGLVLLDDGASPEERPPDALTERCAFHLDSAAEDVDDDQPAPAHPLPLAEVGPPSDEVLHALAEAALVFGVQSSRAGVFSLRAARAHAALKGRSTITSEDAGIAAALVLGPRATQLPEVAPEDAPPPDQAPPEAQESEGQGPSDKPMEDVVLEAARAALPPDLLARLAEGAGRGPPPRARGAGERRKSMARGRPAGTRPGFPRGGARLALVATLRAAAPWQKLRASDGGPRVKVRRDDLRIRRYEARAETTTIFLVDASGSAAFARLAEAKGAVELMLAQAHVTRAEVAVAAFRGAGAELLLPPTRSLTRARRALAELPGGGGTPIAAGLDLGRALAAAVKSKGRTPAIVVLTDGRANIAADGTADRARADADARASARALAAAGLTCIVIDISARPQPEAAALAAAMRARYVALPRGDSAAMHRVLGA